MPNRFPLYHSSSPHGSGDLKVQWLSSDPTTEPASSYPGTREQMLARYRPLEDKASPAVIPYTAQEIRRFSGRPPIPRPSLLHPGTRERISELPTSGGQRPALQLSALELTGCLAGDEEKQSLRFCFLTHGSAGANTTLPLESPAKTGDFTKQAPEPALYEPGEPLGDP
ncbi:UNVERIFIED_CONTAM: hypothetical protein FKN15_045596 [Acipenser sinensis]